MCSGRTHETLLQQRCKYAAIRLGWGLGVTANTVLLVNTVNNITLVLMLANTRVYTSKYTFVSVLLNLHLVKKMPFRGEVMNAKEFAFVAACLLENVRTNEFAKMERILALMGLVKDAVSCDPLVKRLLRLGLVERPAWGLFVVTNEGEYWIRDIETMLVRITKNTVKSKWRKILDDNDPRKKYVRVKRVKGAKVVAVPVDDRLKLKHGIDNPKKNGQPRNINLPGAGKSI